MHFPEGLENTPFSISGLKMMKMVKSGLEKIFLKFLHALTIFYYLIERRSFGQKSNSVIRMTW